MTRFQNLLGVPSYHYDPVFARRARDAVRSFRPSVIALEYPEAFRDELEWAASCWPAPVCSRFDGRVLPFVAGDSILEAYRLARANGIPVELVDLLGEPIVRPVTSIPGAECAERVGDLFLETVDALEQAAGPPAPGDVAREAHMARCLRALMETHVRVLWVGGMAHWSRLVERLATSDFEAPPHPVAPKPRFERLRLAPSALERLTGRVPNLVARYATDPEHYDEATAIRAMALEALEESKEADVVLLLPGIGNPADTKPVEEAASPADMTRFLVYARNVAVCRHIGDRPDLGALLLAACSTIGNHYAGRLFLVAMQCPPQGASAELPELQYNADEQEPCFRLHGRRIRIEPVWGRGFQHRSERGFSLREAQRRLRGVAHFDLPGASEGERTAWCAYPPDEEAYEAFVHYVLRRATLADPNEAKSTPFLCGLLDGLDVRATVRHWHDGKVYVREEAPTRLNITNGVIDFSSASETSPVLRGRLPGGSGGGWIDPSLLHVGSASREVNGSEILRREPYVLQRCRRFFSMITLDCPTWLKQDDSKSFYGRVVRRLIHLPPEDDHLYGWLEVMFAFCAGKPLVYYSRYVPSLRIHRIAWKHGVRVVHCPLRRIPRPLLERNQEFLFFNLTRQQWEALLEQMAERKSAWTTVGNRGAE